MTRQQQAGTHSGCSKRKFSIFASALVKSTITRILTVLFTVDSFAQIQQPQIPATAGGVQPITLGQSYSNENNFYNLSEFPQLPTRNSGGGITIQDIDNYYRDLQNSIQPLSQNYPRVPTAQDIINQLNSRDPYYGIGLDPKKNQQIVQKYQMEQMRKDPAYQTPNSSNGFTNLAFQREKEMVDLLLESHYNTSVVGDAKYYSSAQYLKDLPNYTKAKDLIKDMVEGKRTLSIKDAYYLAESAYGNLQLSYEEYNNIIKANVNFIRQWLVENGYNPKDIEALHLGIQKFLSDSLFTGKNSMDKIQPERQGHSPYYYDYLDNISVKDRKNYFVTKTLATGSGQCHTLPITYLILAEALGVETYLAYNPVHSFIRYKNNKGTVMNYETTVDRFLSDQFYLETLPVMATAQKNKIYINSMNKKQVVASVLYDLAVNFVVEHWLSDKTFIRECMNIAAPCFPNQDFISTSNNYLNKRLFADAFNTKVQEKGIKNLSEIEKYPDALEAYNNYGNYMEKISSLGIQDFPESEYLRLLEFYDYKGKLQIAKKIDAKSKKNLFFSQ